MKKLGIWIGSATILMCLLCMNALADTPVPTTPCGTNVKTVASQEPFTLHGPSATLPAVYSYKWYVYQWNPAGNGGAGTWDLVLPSPAGTLQDFSSTALTATTTDVYEKIVLDIADTRAPNDALGNPTCVNTNCYEFIIKPPTCPLCNAVFCTDHRPGPGDCPNSISYTRPAGSNEHWNWYYKYTATTTWPSSWTYDSTDTAKPTINWGTAAVGLYQLRFVKYYGAVTQTPSTIAYECDSSDVAANSALHNYIEIVAIPDNAITCPTCA
jgi:hypothetical protein